MKFTPEGRHAVGGTFVLTENANLTDSDLAANGGFIALDDGIDGALSVNEDGELVYSTPGYFFIRLASGEGGWDIRVDPYCLSDALGILCNTLSKDDGVKSTAPNGYSYIDSYLLGLDPKDPASTLSLEGSSGGEPGVFTVSLSNVTFPPVAQYETTGGKSLKAVAKLLSSTDGVTFLPVEGATNTFNTASTEPQRASITFTPTLSDRKMRFFA